MAFPVDGEDKDAVDYDDEEAEKGRAHGLHHVPGRGRGRVLEYRTPAREVGYIGHCLLPHHVTRLARPDASLFDGNSDTAKCLLLYLTAARRDA